MSGKAVQFVSVESPYNAIWPWTQWRNIQYAIMCNFHAASKGDATYAPHLCNTQVTKFGFNGYVGDSIAAILLQLGCCTSPHATYAVTRNDTLRITNEARTRKMDKIVLYVDFGKSNGMQSAEMAARESGVPVEERTLPPELMSEVFGQSLASTALPLLKIATINSLVAIGVRAILKRF